MSRYQSTKYYSLLILGLLAVFFVLLKPPADPDLGWHLKLGEFILKNQQFPRENLFSYTFPNYQWADSYWLTQVLLVLLVEFFGLLGLSLIFALLATISLGLVTRFNPYLSFLLSLLLTPAVGVRPLVVSLLLLSLLWTILQKLRHNLNDRLLLTLPFLFLLWANIHADFVIGLLILAIFLAIEAFRQQRFRRPLLIWLASFLATFINPYGSFLWRTLMREAGSQLMRNNIAEWLPPNSHTLFGLYLLAFLLAVILIFFVNRKNLWPSETVLIVLFALLSLFSLYHVRFLVVLSAPFLVRSLKTLPPLPLFPSKTSRRFFELYASLTLAVFVIGVGPLVLDKVFSEDVADYYPTKAITFLREHPQEGHIFNTYSWGGFLIWRLPEVKTFIDGRMPAWKIAGESVLADYLTVTSLKPNWEEVLKKHKIGYVLIETESPLAQALRVHPDWTLIYSDNLAAIFVPTTPAVKKKTLTRTTNGPTGS